MKTFKEFLAEANPPKSDAYYTISKNWERKPQVKKFNVTMGNRGDLRVHGFEVYPQFRGQGYGTKALGGLNRYADSVNKRITLTPQAERGYKGKLKKFYNKLGFVPNKGRNKDFSVSDTMIRNPRT
jgi:GNAT superfamily N-acetyltransferase